MAQAGPLTGIAPEHCVGAAGIGSDNQALREDLTQRGMPENLEADLAAWRYPPVYYELRGLAKTAGAA